MQARGNIIPLTGGTSGIGLVLLEQFYSEGKKIIVASSNPAKLYKLHKELPKVASMLCYLGCEGSSGFTPNSEML